MLERRRERFNPLRGNLAVLPQADRIDTFADTKCCFNPLRGNLAVLLTSFVQYARSMKAGGFNPLRGNLAVLPAPDLLPTMPPTLLVSILYEAI